MVSLSCPPPAIHPNGEKDEWMWLGRSKKIITIIPITYTYLINCWCIFCTNFPSPPFQKEKRFCFAFVKKWMLFIFFCPFGFRQMFASFKVLKIILNLKKKISFDPKPDLNLYLLCANTYNFWMKWKTKMTANRTKKKIKHSLNESIICVFTLR